MVHQMSKKNAKKKDDAPMTEHLVQSGTRTRRWVQLTALTYSLFIKKRHSWRRAWQKKEGGEAVQQETKQGKIK